MLVCISNVLDPAQLVSVRERLDRANSWVDGRVTAGYQGAPLKFNQQIDERSEVALACQRIIVSPSPPVRAARDFRFSSATKAMASAPSTRSSAR